MDPLYTLGVFEAGDEDGPGKLRSSKFNTEIRMHTHGDLTYLTFMWGGNNILAIPHVEKGQTHVALVQVVVLRSDFPDGRNL